MSGAKLAACAAALALAVPVFAQLTQPERKQIDDALFVRNLTADQLKASRAHLYSGHALSLVEQSTADPLGTADLLLAAHSGAASGTATDLLTSALKLAYPDQETGSASINQSVKITLVKGALRDVLSNLASAILSANEDVNGALSRLTPEDQAGLVRRLAVLAGDTDYSMSPNEMRSTRAMTSQIDLARMRGAALALTASVEDAASTLSQSNVDVPSPLTISVGGLKILVTPRKGANVDVGSADLVIALGGHNTFRGAPASGVRRAAVLIDLGQTSTYDCDEFSLGSGVMGIGVAVVKAGDCDFRCASGSVGSGLAGVGVFYKAGGNDFYRVGRESEGFGFYGIGLCIDTGGQNNWTADSWSQGAARTDGLGWLIDRGDGPVLTVAGATSGSRTVPRASSQGYSAGYGNDLIDAPGGLGLLTLTGKSRTLIAGSDSQGAAEFGGVGSVYARSGTTSLQGQQRCQANAAHDAYAAVFDLGVAASATESKGVGQVSSWDHSVAIFDARGGSVTLNSSGPVGQSDASSLSIQLNADAPFSYRGYEQAGLSFPTSFQAAPVSEPDGGGFSGVVPTIAEWYDEKPILAYPRIPSKPGNKTVDSGDIERLWNLATTKDSTAVTDLLEYGRPALEWGIRNRLGVGLAPDRELAEYLTEQLSDSASPAFASLVVATDQEQMRQAMRVAAVAQLQDGAGLVPHALTMAPAVRVEACLLAGRLRAKSQSSSLLPLLLDPDPTVVRAAMFALSQIADESTVGSAQAMLSSPDALTRSYAIALLSQYPNNAIGTGRTMLAGPDESQARTAMQLLARTDSPDALILVADQLKDPRPGIRATALYELNGRFPPPSRALAKSLANDPDERVRLLAKQVKIDP